MRHSRNLPSGLLGKTGTPLGNTLHTLHSAGQQRSASPPATPETGEKHAAPEGWDADFNLLTDTANNGHITLYAEKGSYKNTDGDKKQETNLPGVLNINALLPFP